MKKFLLYVSAAAAMMLAGSCQKEALAPVSEGETSVKFSIALPDGLQTKAMSMAESTDIVYYEIWNSEWTRQLYPVEQTGVQSAYASAVVNGCKATIDLKLVSDQTYNFIFWAQNEACGAYNVDNLKNVGVNYDVIGAEGNQDKFDAFYAIETIRVEGPINKTVTLYRPFAQLNFGADEMTTTFGDIVVTDTEIQVSGLATVFNTLTGYGEQAVTEPVAFQANGIATDETLVAAGKPYTWVAMDYMLMMDNQALVNVEASFGVDGMDEPVTHSLTNVPLKKNYRTNIVGDLFTTDAKLQIIVDPDFNQPDETRIIVDNSDDLALAIAAAKDGDTIYISDEVTMPYFTGKTLNFVGITAHAAVRQSPAAHNDAHYAGAGLNFSKLTLIGTSYTNATQGYQKAAKETYTECHFVNYIMFAGEETVVTDCTFENEGQYFWTGTAKNITFNDCVFNGKERAVKVCTVGNHADRTATFNNCQFTAETQVKSALEIDGSKGSTYTVYVNGCTATGFATSEFTGESLFNIEGAENVTVYVDGNEWAGKGLYEDPNGNPVVTSIEGLQYALDNAAEGTTTIFFGKDLVGDVIVKQVEGKNFVIDGKGYNYDGTIYIWGNARYEGAETLDIKNVNFKHADGAIDFISSNTTASAERYAHNVTIEGCTFEGGANAVAAKFRQAYDIVIKDSEVIAGHSLAQLTGCTGVAIEGVDVKAGRGVSFGTSTNCTVSGSVFEAASYGLRADGTIKEGSLSVSNTSIKADQPIIVRKMTGEYAVALNVVVLETEAAYQVVFTNGADDAAYVKPDGTYTLTGAEGLCVYPVADADSFAAAVANEGLAVVDLEGAVESAGLGFKIERDVILNMNGHEFNAGSTANSYWYALEAYGEHNVVINDANMTRAGVFAGEGADVVFNSGKINHKPERTSRYIFCAKNEGTTITIKDGTFKNDRAKNSFFWADGGAVIYVEGGNFGGVASTKKVYTSNGGQVIITGGTFNFDPTAWVAEGCTITKSGSTWTVSK